MRSVVLSGKGSVEVTRRWAAHIGHERTLIVVFFAGDRSNDFSFPSETARLDWGLCCWAVLVIPLSDSERYLLLCQVLRCSNPPSWPLGITHCLRPGLAFENSSPALIPFIPFTTQFRTYTSTLAHILLSSGPLSPNQNHLINLFLWIGLGKFTRIYEFRIGF